MLVVAIPKSASTSLMRTIGILHGLPSRQILVPDLPVPHETTILHKYHSDLREYTHEQLKLFCQSSTIYKQHIPPTTRNLALLSGVPKVVLLRNPEEVVCAYRRAQRARIHRERVEFRGAKTEQAWLQVAERNGLLADLVWFYEAWSSPAGGNRLVIGFHELVENPTLTINRIEEFFHLPRTSEKVVLAKERYSRYPATRVAALRAGKTLLAVMDRVGRRVHGHR